VDPRLDVPEFAGLRVAVAGDLICDHHVVAEPRGLSREAPVMVLRHRSESVGAGGAANVARNLRALGATTLCLGALGRDARGREVIERLESEGVDVAGVRTHTDWTTPTKTRVLAAEPRRWPQQVLRIDREPDAPLAAAARARLGDDVRSLAGRVDALVISDYGYGAVGDELAAAAAELAAEGVVVVLDPRRRVHGFGALTGLTPNLGEVATLCAVEPTELEAPARLAAFAQCLRERAGARHLLVTRGNLGMALWSADGAPEGLWVPASGSGNVTDVSGAGDTAAAVFALALAAGSAAPRAMELANAAAGVVVMESGAATCGREALCAALPQAARPSARAPRALAGEPPA
jgi:D-glycero-beta-D-manno-heptose-7-phosphate kinase